MADRETAKRRFWDKHSKRTYRCPDCGRPDSNHVDDMEMSAHLYPVGFEVHHIDGDPSNNDLDNLVALCTDCHHTRHGKQPPISLRNAVKIPEKYRNDEWYDDLEERSV